MRIKPIRTAVETYSNGVEIHRHDTAASRRTLLIDVRHDHEAVPDYFGGDI